MLSRLLGIIYILLKKGTVTAGELAEHFEVSVRTVYRDVEQLSLAGIPIYARKGKNGGISLTEQFVLDKMMISEEEQQRILAALVSLRETGAQEEEEILQKLGTFFKSDVTDWVSIDFSDWSGRRQQLFEQIREAILKRRVLEFDYYGQYGEMTHRIAEPVQLLFKDYTWYVRAYCRKRQAMRLFKVLRMKRVVLREETFESGKRHHDVKIEGNVNQEQLNFQCDKLETNIYGEGMEEAAGMLENAINEPEQALEMTEIKIIIDKKEAYRVYDRFEEEEIEVLPDGNFRITMHCLLDDWVYGTILSFGPSAKVLSPEPVREKIIEKISEMKKNYL